MESTHNWEKIGYNVKGLKDSSDILKAAKLDWTVKKYPIIKPNGSECENLELLIKEGETENDCTELTVCPKAWKPTTNYQFIRKCQAIADKVDGHISRAGWQQKLGNARERLNLVWAMIELGNKYMDRYSNLPSSLNFQPYLLVNNAHNYGYGLSVSAFFVRLVCSNGMTAVEKVTQKYTHIGEGISDKSVSNLEKAIDHYVKSILGLSQTEMNEQQAYLWLISQYGKPSKEFHEQPVKVKLLWDIYQGNMDSDFAEFGINLAQKNPDVINTAYGLLQAVVAYENHFGIGSLEGNLISLWREDAKTEIAKVQNSLQQVAIARQKRQGHQVVSVSTRW